MSHGVSLDVATNWIAIRESVKRICSLSEPAYRTWVRENLFFDRYEDGIIYVDSLDVSNLGYIVKKFTVPLQEAILEVTGHKVEVYIGHQTYIPVKIYAPGKEKR